MYSVNSKTWGCKDAETQHLCLMSLKVCSEMCKTWPQATKTGKWQTDVKESKKRSVSSPVGSKLVRGQVQSSLWREIREKNGQTPALSILCFFNSPCSDNKPRFVLRPALSGKIHVINYSVIGRGGTSELDVMLVPKMVLSSQTVFVLLHWELCFEFLFFNSVSFFSRTSHLLFLRQSIFVPSVTNSYFLNEHSSALDHLTFLYLWFWHYQKNWDYSKNVNYVSAYCCRRLLLSIFQKWDNRLNTSAKGVGPKVR